MDAGSIPDPASEKVAAIAGVAVARRLPAAGAVKDTAGTCVSEGAGATFASQICASSREPVGFAPFQRIVIVPARRKPCDREAPWILSTSWASAPELIAEEEPPTGCPLRKRLPTTILVLAPAARVAMRISLKSPATLKEGPLTTVERTRVMVTRFRPS